MGYERLHRSFIQHRGHAALDPMSEQLAPKLLTFVLGQSTRPALGLRFNVGEHLGQRLELDETVQSERQWLPILNNDRGGRYELVQRNLLCPNPVISDQRQEHEGENRSHLLALQRVSFYQCSPRA